MVLLFIIIVLMIFRFLIPAFFEPDYSRYSQEYRELVMMMEDLESDTAEVAEPIKVNHVVEAKNPSYSVPKSKPDSKNETQPAIIKPELTKFDPNTASFTELISLGFSSKVAGTIVKYREKGGRFYKTSDLLKVYGIDTIFYKTVFPYIVIPGSKNQTIEKAIEINSADTAQWMSLKGIGPVYAKRICNYRNLLGGFVSVEQLKEVYGFPEETFLACKDFLFVDPALVRKIDLNFSDVEELAKHPYCDFNTARKIVNYRSEKGIINTSKALLTCSAIDSATYVKLKPYLSPD